MSTTQTGIPIIDCEECGYRHPITRQHCPVCGAPSLFPMIHCMRPIEGLEDAA